MQKILILLILFVNIVMLCGCENENHYSEPEDNKIIINEANVVILIGQSNAEGHTHNSMLMQTNPDLFNKYFDANSSKTKIIHKCVVLEPNNINESKSFESVKLGMGYSFERFGPEIGMTEVFDSQEFERETFIIKYTQGGSILQTQWVSPSSNSQTGVLYSGMIEYVLECLSLLEEQGYFPYIKAVCWMQGESDGGYYSAQYEKNELNLISDIRNDLGYYLEEGDNKIKFISAGISQYWTNYQIINNAKKYNANLDSQNNYYIDTVALNLSYDKEPINNVDIYHYDSLAMIELGKAFAEAILSFNVLK